MLRIVFSLLTVVLFAQESDVVQQLERERLAVQEPRPFTSMVRVTAVHMDGTPARGSISCTGNWLKFDEKPVGGWRIPFETDSHGSIILNPWMGDYEEDPLICYATDKHGHQGHVTFTMPSRYAEITVQ